MAGPYPAAEGDQRVVTEGGASAAAVLGAARRQRREGALVLR